MTQIVIYCFRLELEDAQLKIELSLIFIGMKLCIHGNKTKFLSAKFEALQGVRKMKPSRFTGKNYLS